MKLDRDRVKKTIRASNDLRALGNRRWRSRQDSFVFIDNSLFNFFSFDFLKKSYLGLIVVSRNKDVLFEDSVDLLSFVPTLFRFIFFFFSFKINLSFSQLFFLFSTFFLFLFSFQTFLFFVFSFCFLISFFFFLFFLDP